MELLMTRKVAPCNYPNPGGPSEWRVEGGMAKENSTMAWSVSMYLEVGTGSLYEAAVNTVSTFNCFNHNYMLAW